jgi:tetratricopeptide (TPR) repeat protein
VGSVAEIEISHCPKQKIVRQAVPLTKAAARDFGLLALTLNANGDREQALAMAQKAVALDPGNFWAELSYGFALENSNRLDEALKALETPSTSSNLQMAEALRQIHRAVLYARKGDTAKAQEIYFSAVSHIDPRCLPAVMEKEAFMALAQPTVNNHLAKAKQLDAQGKYAESLPEYAQALSYAANEQEASALRAALFAASSKMPTPPELPEEAHRRVVRGELLLKQGMLDRALVEFDEALRMAPYAPKLYYNMALIYGELKQYDRAIRQMRLYLTIAPEAPDARTAQDQITKWELQQEIGDKR